MWSQLTGGERHVCGLTVRHEAYCWGDNGSGQVGNGTSGAAVLTPTLVHGGLRFH